MKNYIPQVFPLISIDLLKAFDTVDHKDHNEVKQKNLC